MFSFSLCASLTTLIVSAVAVSAAPSLSVKTSTPNVNVHGVENLKVTTTIINTGNESLKLLNDPRGVLNPFPENTFIITNTARSPRPWFNGAMVNYNPTYPTYAAGLDDPSVFTVLAPGASTNVTHDLSATYNFTLSGTGNYSIEPSSHFTYLDVNGTLKDLHATVEDIAEVRLSDLIYFAHAIEEARARITDAIAFISQMIDTGGDPPPRWKTWFGPRRAHCDAGRVRDVFNNMIEHGLNNLDYRCGRCDATPLLTAFLPDIRGNLIILCPEFWNLPIAGPDSMTGNLIRLTSLFRHIGSNQQLAVGEIFCRLLPSSIYGFINCVWNADSYWYFALDPDSDNDVAHQNGP